MKRVLVLGAQVPFVRGGAELLNESLVNEINKREGLQAELVQLPYKAYPEDQIIEDMLAWRMLDLSEFNEKKIDLVIATKFPSYAPKHDNKVLWLVHQHRSFYDLEFSKYDQAQHDQVTRDTIRRLDSKFLQECSPRYSIAQNVTSRLKKFNYIDSKPLYPPAPLSEHIVSGEYGDYILYVGRVERIKRVDLLIDAIALCQQKVKLIIVGKGDDLPRCLQQIKQLGLEKQVQVSGYVSEEQLIDYLANCRALFYAPYDEDYGYATIEAFLAQKPVLTCLDSGEVANIVSKTNSGYVCANEPKLIAENIDKTYQSSNEQLEQMAQKGYEFAKNISWNEVIQKLVLDNLK